MHNRQSSGRSPAEAARNDVARHRRGFLLVVLATLAWSTAGFFTRLIPLDAWTILFWRGLFGALTGLLVIIIQERQRFAHAFAAMRWPDFLFSVVSTLGMVTFLASLKLTTVAHVSIIYATVPFLAAGLAWLILRERASLPTLVASAIALVGVGVMFASGSREGGALGDVLAFIMTMLMAAMIVIRRATKMATMVPAACLSALLSALVSLPFASPLAVSQVDLINLATFGTTNMGLGLILFTIGAQLIPAAQTALIGALEAPLAVLWVRLAFDEVPNTATIVGGAIVLSAVLGHLLVEPGQRQGSTG